MNQASFDPANKSKHISALHCGKSENSLLLGVPFDHALSMRDAVGEIFSKVTWEVASILRSARFFAESELVNLYKSQLLLYLEFNTAAVYYACNNILAPRGKFPNRFLKALGSLPKMRFCILN